MDNVVLVKSLLADLDMNADAYQDVMFQSQMAKAVQVHMYMFMASFR